MLPTLEIECSEFIQNSYGYPLLKNLPANGLGFRKVKVRKKKNLKNDIVEVFNSTFNSHRELMQRSVFAQSQLAFKECENIELAPFYIFPINGYKFLYAEGVDDTTETYKDTLNKLIENYGEKGIRTFTEILKYQYTFSKLDEGLASSTEIIIYDIPYYYAIRCNLIENYQEFLSSTSNS